MTVRDGKVYSGTSSYYSDIICTIQDGKVYSGTSTYYSDIVCTVRDRKVYDGTSSYYSDIAFHYDGHLSTAEFVAVLYVVSDLL